MSRPHSDRRKLSPASGQPPHSAQSQSSRIVLLTTMATTAGLLGENASGAVSNEPVSGNRPVLRATQTPAWSNWPGCRKAATAGVARAIARWQSQAVLKDVVISGPSAAGGSVTGPALQPDIERTMAEAGVPAAVAKAFAAPVSSAWSAWASSLRAPGLNWYPSFASFPGPVAPPMPNVPTPLMALGGNPNPLSAASLKASIRNALGTRANEPQTSAAINEFADDFAARFAKYLAGAKVTNVMGTGPVPTFAPPYVPVGPVVGGKGTMKAGGFAGSWPAN
jgi:hypothetical protein